MSVDRWVFDVGGMLRLDTIKTLLGTSAGIYICMLGFRILFGIIMMLMRALYIFELCGMTITINMITE